MAWNEAGRAADKIVESVEGFSKESSKLSVEMISLTNKIVILTKVMIGVGVLQIILILIQIYIAIK